MNILKDDLYLVWDGDVVREAGLAQMREASVLEDLVGGEFHRPLMVFQVNLSDGIARDVSADFAYMWWGRFKDLQDPFDCTIPEFIEKHIPDAHDLLAEWQNDVKLEQQHERFEARRIHAL